MEKAPAQRSRAKANGNQKPRLNANRAIKRHNAVNDIPSRSSELAHIGSFDHLLHLQRMLGNHAVGRLLQAKLTVSHPDDPYEREADRVADTVMRMPAPAPPEEEETLVQTKPLATQISRLVQRELQQQLEEEEEQAVATNPLVQRVPVSVREDDEEKAKVTAKLEPSAALQEEEQDKPIQAKLKTDTAIQRQAKQDEEKEEEPLQSASPIEGRMEEEDEGEVQTKPLSGVLLRMPGISPVSASPSGGAVQRLCTECEGEKQREEGKPAGMVQRKSARSQLHDDQDEEEQRVQPKGVDSATPPVTTSMAANIHSLNHGGSPLSQATRAFFEPRFGADFSQVRVHTDARTGGTAKSINAKAFTVGHNIAFGAEQYSPHSREGRQLLAHELTHVVQQTAKLGATDSMIHRQPAPTATATPADKGTSDAAPARPTKPIYYYRNFVMTTDETFMADQFRWLIGKHGLTGADQWYELMVRENGISPEMVGFGVSAHTYGRGPRVKTPIDTQREMREQQLAAEIVPVVKRVYLKIREEAVKFLEDFEKQAKANAESTLKANEEQGKAEGIRYGLTSQQIEKIRYQKTGEGPYEKIVEHETKYDMDKDSPAAAGLKDAAKVLLDRRRDIEKDWGKQSSHLKLERDPSDPKGRILVPDEQYYVIGKQMEEKITAYNNMRSFLSSQFPILAAFSELDKGTGDLETLAKKGTGPDMAALIGQEIARKQAKIDKVREGLKDGGVNVWRQPKMVDLTQVQFGAKDDPMKRRLVDDKVKDEQPGFLFDLALAVLNIAALLLAAPTGGASLVVAAGVNIAVTAVHVQEYLMQSALSGTAFDKAQAISAEDPSLFWLALEIVGTGLDVGPAAGTLFKGFKRLAPLVKAAKAATKGEEAVKSLQAVRAAAVDVKGAEVAKKIVAQVKNLQKGEAAVLEGAKITSDEIKLLQKAGKTAEEAAASGIGKGFKAATGEVNLSKSGHIFSCASPCTELGDKYAKIFAQGGEFNDDFVKLQKRAHDVAQAEKIAKEAKDVKALARAEEAAEQIKKDAAALESRIRQANPQLLSLDELEKLLDLPEFAKGTPKGNNLRFVRYQKQGGALPFDEWQRRATQIWKNSSTGTLTEKELQEAWDLGLKNNLSMTDKTGAKSFIPDHVEGFPERLEWGKPYHFKEIKDWQSMSDTGNLKAMLDYVKNTPGSKITLYYRSNARMSGPLMAKIDELRQIGKAELLPFVGR